jgi:hypothetical protein
VPDDRGGVSPVGRVRGGGAETPDLAQARDREVAVVHAGERSEQGYAFHSEEIRQRVLVDHGRVDRGITH